MTKLPPNVKTVSRIAAGLGLVQSTVYLVLSSLALASYLECSWSRLDDTELPVTSNFGDTLQRFFFLGEHCSTARTLDAPGVVSAYELHVWAASIVALSGVWFIASSCIFFFVTDANASNVNLALYSWCLLTLAVSAADVALGAVFGVTYEAVGALMNSYPVESEATELPTTELPTTEDPSAEVPSLETLLPRVDGVLPSLLELQALRGGSLSLMVLALRGFVLVVLNVTFSVLLLYYAYLVNSSLNRNEHNIHSMGPLSAYQGPKRPTEPWSMVGFEYDQYERQPGSQLNRSYSRSEQDSWQQTPRRPDDSFRRSFDRSESWHQGKVANQPPRPFTYLEEPQQYKPPPPRAPLPPAPATAAPIPPWKRGASSLIEERYPGLPAPDYSPPQSRQPRLKSALKSPAY